MPISTTSRRRIDARAKVSTGKSGACPTCTSGLIAQAAVDRGRVVDVPGKRTDTCGLAQASGRASVGVDRLSVGR